MLPRCDQITKGLPEYQDWCMAALIQRPTFHETVHLPGTCGRVSSGSRVSTAARVRSVGHHCPAIQKHVQSDISDYLQLPE